MVCPNVEIGPAGQAASSAMLASDATPPILLVAARRSAMSDFDYVIVGAGSAGCTLARRLTESGAYRVLLLEAGGSDRRLWVQMPIGYGMCFYNPGVNWMYQTEPEPALDGRRGYWPRGKAFIMLLPGNAWEEKSRIYVE